jgi:Zn-dependent protease with chaperone function
MLFVVLYTLAGLMIGFTLIIELKSHFKNRSGSRKKRGMKKSPLNKMTFLAIFFLWPFYLYGLIDLNGLGIGMVFIFLYHVVINVHFLRSVSSAAVNIMKSTLLILTLFAVIYFYFFVLSPLLLSGLLIVSSIIVLVLFDRLHPYILQKFFRVVPYYYNETLPFLSDMKISSKLHMIEIEGYASVKNAMIVGLFRPYRLYVFKGMLASMNHREIMGIIAHEVGHIKRHHLRIRLLIGAFGLVGVFFTGIVVTRLDNDALMNYTLLILGSIILGYLFRVVLSLTLQKQEFEADQYAWEVGQGEALKSALKKLKRSEPSHVNRLIHKMFATHPDTEERIERLSISSK